MDRPRTDSAPARLLVVEDNEGIRSLLAECLRDVGYAVEEASEGAAAIRALEAHCLLPDYYCGVLLDLRLPHMSGLEVLRRLVREMGGYTPVVAMSASSLALEVAQEAGAVAVVQKPFDLDQLLALLQQHCRHTDR